MHCFWHIAAYPSTNHRPTNNRTATTCADISTAHSQTNKQTDIQSDISTDHWQSNNIGSDNS
jgi:hypothetical protein